LAPLLGEAFGGSTYKLKFGHRGGNQPIKDLTTGKIEIRHTTTALPFQPTACRPRSR
jgi:carbamoyl-phosphate synthase small subunit